jgi:hypothetical protein
MLQPGAANVLIRLKPLPLSWGLQQPRSGAAAPATGAPPRAGANPPGGGQAQARWPAGAAAPGGALAKPTWPGPMRVLATSNQVCLLYGAPHARAWAGCPFLAWECAPRQCPVRSHTGYGL